jgi:hypothetical protein
MRPSTRAPRLRAFGCAGPDDEFPLGGNQSLQWRLVRGRAAKPASEYRWVLPPDYALLAEFSDIVLPTDQGVAAAIAASGPDPDTDITQEVCLLGSAVDPKDVELAAYDSDDALVRAIAARLGIPNKRLGSKFCCILPGHQETHPSASLWKDRRGLWVYRCFHGRHVRSSFALAEVFASVVAGRVLTPNGPSLSRWKIRLLSEVGAVSLDRVEVPLLPAGASRTARKVREGFSLLLRATWWREPAGTPVTYALSFVRDWADVPPSSAQRAKGELIQAGVIKKVGETSCGGRRTSLYLPGQCGVLGP